MAPRPACSSSPMALMPSVARSRLQACRRRRCRPNTGAWGLHSAALARTRHRPGSDGHGRHPDPGPDARTRHRFRRLLYVGLAITKAGPRVVEFNARFGDPETEVVLPLLHTPLGQVLYAAATGSLAKVGRGDFDDRAAVCVVFAAKGYPAHRARAATSACLPKPTGCTSSMPAPRFDADGRLTANGGRVLVVVGIGDDLADARAAVYEHIAKIDFPDGFCRSDIAAKAI